MKTILFIISISTVSACAVSNKTQQSSLVNQHSKDSRGNEMLVGKCTRSSLNEIPFSEWYQKNYNDYKVDSATCVFIRPLLKDKNITIFLGTWCGDSKREVPRILKMLDCCGFPEKQLQLIMVSNLENAYKQSPQHEEKGRNIVRVPTIIIEEKGKEVGRIVEFPKVSLEKDMLTILRRETYVPNYSVAP